MTVEDEEKSARAEKIVRTYMFGSAAAGILPIPLLDVGVLGGIQLRMLSQLAKLYDVEFSEQRANVIIGSLTGVSLAVSVGTLLRMLLPVPGRVLFNLAGLTLAPASTYALGQVFIQHFESGGSFLTFDEERAKKAYEEKLAQGKKEVEQNYAGVKP